MPQFVENCKLSTWNRVSQGGGVIQIGSVTGVASWDPPRVTFATEFSALPNIIASLSNDHVANVGVNFAIATGSVTGFTPEPCVGGSQLGYGNGNVYTTSAGVYTYVKTYKETPDVINNFVVPERQITTTSWFDTNLRDKPMYYVCTALNGYDLQSVSWELDLTIAAPADKLQFVPTLHGNTVGFIGLRSGSVDAATAYALTLQKNFTQDVTTADYIPHGNYTITTLGAQPTLSNYSHIGADISSTGYTYMFTNSPNKLNMYMANAPMPTALTYTLISSSAASTTYRLPVRRVGSNLVPSTVYSALPTGFTSVFFYTANNVAPGNGITGGLVDASDICTVVGNPAVVLHIDGINELLYKRATDAAGTSWLSSPDYSIVDSQYLYSTVGPIRMVYCGDRVVVLYTLLNSQAGLSFNSYDMFAIHSPTETGETTFWGVPTLIKSGVRDFDVTVTNGTICIMGWQTVLNQNATYGQTNKYGAFSMQLHVGTMRWMAKIIQ